MNPHQAAERSLLEHISTHWTMVEDPTKFVLRYAPAIREYIDNLLKGHLDSEDVTQDFLLVVMSRGFSEKQVTRGRFRDFLRVAVRNAVIDHVRSRRGPTTDQSILQDSLASRDENEGEWIRSWRECLLDKAWRVLRQYQRSQPGNLYHTALKLATDYPNADSVELARRASEAAGKSIRADSYRQLLHRARRKFAEIIVEEVAETLRQKNQEEIDDELCELGLDAYVRNFVD